MQEVKLRNILAFFRHEGSIINFPTGPLLKPGESLCLFFCLQKEMGLNRKPYINCTLIK